MISPAGGEETTARLPPPPPPTLSNTLAPTPSISRALNGVLLAFLAIVATSSSKVLLASSNTSLAESRSFRSSASRAVRNWARAVSTSSRHSTTLSSKDLDRTSSVFSRDASVASRTFNLLSKSLKRSSMATCFSSRAVLAFSMSEKSDDSAFFFFSEEGIAVVLRVRFCILGVESRLPASLFLEPVLATGDLAATSAAASDESTDTTAAEDDEMDPPRPLLLPALAGGLAVVALTADCFGLGFVGCCCFLVPAPTPTLPGRGWFGGRPAPISRRLGVRAARMPRNPPLRGGGLGGGGRRWAAIMAVAVAADGGTR